MSKAVILLILIPAMILLVFGSSFNYHGIATRILDWLEFIGENIAPLSLTGGHDFGGGFKEASLAALYLVNYPIRVVWSIFQVIYYTAEYWGVAI